MPASRDIRFDSGGQACCGVHYLPAVNTATSEHQPRPCVILAHGFGGTMDAGLHAYAEAFAQAGLHALVFDYRHFGRSQGHPRQHISLSRQRQDWHAAIAWARSQHAIDAEQIALWGFSLAGGHVVDVAARDRRVRAVIAQFPMLDGAATIRHVYRYAGGRQVARLTTAGLLDSIGCLLTRRPHTIPVVGPPGTLAALTTEDAEPGYKAIAPADWRNEVCARVTLAIPFYRPGRRLTRVQAPVLIQIASQDTVLPLAPIERFSATRPASTRCEYYAGGHFDGFHGPMFDGLIADQIAFLEKHLDVRKHESQST